jgi:DNA-binding response OmpR family regulator
MQKDKPGQKAKEADIYAVPSEKEKPKPGKLILIVDDKGSFRKIMSYMLQKEGYHVVDAPDGETAIKVAKEKRPDLIFMDIMMPGIDGVEACLRLRTDPETSSIPIIMLTAKGQREDVITAIKAGAIDYIIKPCNKEIILSKLKKYI